MTSFQYLQFIWTIAIIYFTVNIKTVTTHSDWIQNCSACRCNWVSGKRTADCKDKRLTKLPHDMSSELQVIDISKNEISQLQSQVFMAANFQNLHKLYMRSCKLQYVNREALKGLAILIELDLSHNSIQVLQPGTFEGLEKLRNVVLNYNDIEVLNNFLFENLTNLLRVEIKFNRLRIIETKAFENLPHLSAVDLEGNRLRLLQREVFDRFPKLISLSLARNNWNCSCSLKGFRDFTIKNRLFTPPTDCHDPPKLRGQLWNEISSDDFACKPSIVSPLWSLLNVDTENISLICQVKGFPFPNVTWMINKRPTSGSDSRLKIRNSFENNRSNEENKILKSDLQIFGVKRGDEGVYICQAENVAGKAEGYFQVVLQENLFNALDEMKIGGLAGASTTVAKSNIFFLLCISFAVLFSLIIIVVLLVWRTNKKKTTNRIDKKSRKNLIKVENPSSNVIEMQRSLLKDVNPLEKPPRRPGSETTKESNQQFAKSVQYFTDEKLVTDHPEEEESSIAYSDYYSTKRDHCDLLEENLGRCLPPDLLTFPQRVSTSTPPVPFPQFNVQDRTIYDVFNSAHSSFDTDLISQGEILTAVAAPLSNCFLTLQHPKGRYSSKGYQRERKQLLIPSTPIYNSTFFKKQCYVTVPKKPPISPGKITNLNEMRASNPRSLNSCGTLMTIPMSFEPVYDNLGLRTTAGGNSTLHLNKLEHSQSPLRYTMRDRPLPLTPNTKSDTDTLNKEWKSQYKQTHVDSKECLKSENSPLETKHKNFTTGRPIQKIMNSNPSPIQRYDQLWNPKPEMNNMIRDQNISVNETNNEVRTATQIPPNPPPKPTKKLSATKNFGKVYSVQDFVDDYEDGTEI